MGRDRQKWLTLTGLAIVWGSSFILMKFALKAFAPVQVGALRMIIAFIVLFVFSGKKILLIKKRHWLPLSVNAFAGTFFPFFLFAFAVSHIDSSVVAILNALTPLNTLLVGFILMGFVFNRKQIAGILLGMIATIALVARSAELNPTDDYSYVWLVVIASLGYGISVNVLKKYLYDLDVVATTVGTFLIIFIPGIIVLFNTGFFQMDLRDINVLKSLGYVSLLAIFGSALAKIFYNNLVLISTPVFASSVTYLIPIVALFWGVLDGETIHWSQILAGMTILFAVYLVNNSNRKNRS